jgi:predicted DNA-binding transcriptional regulator YafY
MGLSIEMEDIQKCIQALRDTYEKKKKAVPWQEILLLFSAVKTLRSYDKGSNKKETRVKHINNALNAFKTLLIRLNKIKEVLRRINL